MLEIFLATLTPMFVIFLCIAIGYILNKKKILPDNAATVLSKLENFVLVPALIIKTFMNQCNLNSIIEKSNLILYGALIVGLAVAIAIPLSGLFENKDDYKRCVYKYALTVANFSFLGNAIVPVILGQEALYSYMMFTLPLNIVTYTWGLYVLIPKGENKQSILKSLINPIFISIIVGTILGLVNFKEVCPEFIMTTMNNLAACMGPLAMILTGFVVGGYELKEIIGIKRVYVASFVRLIVLPAIFIALLFVLKAPKEVLILTVFGYATPLGMNTIVFPAAYGGDTKEGASMVIVSQVLSIITIPLVYAIVLSI